MPRILFVLIVAGMLGTLGLTSFRFLDPRIKAPSEAGTGIVVTTSSTPAVVTPVKPVEPPNGLPKQAGLDVPFVTEAPDGIWTGPWKNACEEASMVMVDSFYRGEKSVTTDEAKRQMVILFSYQDKIWGSNANSDVARTVDIIRSQLAFGAWIKESPTAEDIKAEIAAGHPVILPVNGKELGNPNIPFLATGSYYHMLVVIGYDDATGEFITNDDGDEKAGAGRRYKYASLMASVHDYIPATKKTNGPARAIFTLPK